MNQIIKASFGQFWAGSYFEKDSEIPAHGKKKTELVRCGRAYYALKEIEPLTAKPTMANTKKEIEQYLDGAGIEYDEYSTKQELIDLINPVED